MIVEMWQEKFVEGEFVELKRTRQIQTFSPEIFAKLSAENPQDGKTWFSESQYKYTIHHDPRS